MWVATSRCGIPTTRFAPPVKGFVRAMAVVGASGDAVVSVVAAGSVQVLR
jgi:hypothetical protein